MSAILKPRTYTPAEYLELEERAEYRSEYEDGYIVAMAGSSLNHVQITFNLAKGIDRLISKDCRTLPTEMKVWVDDLNKFYYPDVTVICGKPQFLEPRKDVLTNPILLLEVLSDSTEGKDRGKKFLAYQTLDSLREYCLVSQDKAVVEKFTRQPDGSWKYLATIGLGSTVKFESVNVELTLEEIYQRVEFAPEDETVELTETEN